ncbi:hypothetical protein [Nocardiopsis oceani]
MNFSKKLPLSIRAQRVLLWIMATMMCGNAIWSMVLAGGGAFGIGYAMPYFLLGALITVLAIQIKSGAKWVQVVMIVLYSVMILLQVGRMFNGDPWGLIGLFFPIYGLVLALRATAREFFSRRGSGPQRGYAAY